jgi:hypothetical protein
MHAKEGDNHPMNVLFYSASLTGIGKRFFRIVVSHVPQDRIEICRSMALLDSRLHRPLDGLAIAVFHVTDRDELGELITRRDLLVDFRNILVLPDCDENTTALAHVLRPRFVIYSDGDLPDASVILGKLLQGVQTGFLQNRRRTDWSGERVTSSMISGQGSTKG